MIRNTGCGVAQTLDAVRPGTGENCGQLEDCLAKALPAKPDPLTQPRTIPQRSRNGRNTLGQIQEPIPKITGGERERRA
ncbi:MAG: hypothetical protein ABI948_05010 [Thermoleophilia bacterium]